MIQNKSLRIVFFGTTNFSAWHLQELIYSSLCQIIAIFSQPIQSLHRTSSLLSISKITQKYNLPLFLSNSLSVLEIIQIVKHLHIDLIIVVSYGLILPVEILNIPKFGCINVHGSLLPRWRGAAPIQRAIEHGDSITGISIIKMNSGIDTGDILYSKSCNILPKDTSNTLSNRLAKIGSTSLLYILKKITSTKNITSLHAMPQDENHATYAHKLNKREARINWKLSAIQLERCIRAFNPWPVSFFYVQDHRIRVWDATINYYNAIHYIPSTLPGTILTTNSQGIHVITGSGILTLTLLQIAGKKKTLARDLLNAYQKWFLPNSILS